MIYIDRDGSIFSEEYGQRIFYDIINQNGCVFELKERDSDKHFMVKMDLVDRVYFHCDKCKNSYLTDLNMKIIICICGAMYERIYYKLYGDPPYYYKAAFKELVGPKQKLISEWHSLDKEHWEDIRLIGEIQERMDKRQKRLCEIREELDKID